MSTIEKNLKWNGQIDRFFDENNEEYDSSCVNEAINSGREITTYKWTAQGYQ